MLSYLDCRDQHRQAGKGSLVPSKGAPDQLEPDHRHGVVKASLLAAGSFIPAVGTLSAVAEERRTPDETVR
jgi:hypothetical protein